MGVIGAVKQFTSIHGSGIIGIDDEFQEGDICLIESPMNPTGESRNIQYYADKVLIFHWPQSKVWLTLSAIDPDSCGRWKVDCGLYFRPPAAPGPV